MSKDKCICRECKQEFAGGICGDKKFVDIKEDSILTLLEEFNKELIEYLILYNTKRVHKGLNNLTPMDYIILNYPKECQMYWTHTKN